MDIMNRPAEVFVQGLQYTEDATYVGRDVLDTSLACMVMYFWTW